MSEIIINRTHQYPLGDLKAKIDEIKVDIEKRFEFRSEWESDQCLLFRRKGAKGSIEIGEHSFQFTLKLGMMYRAMKAEIKREIVGIVDKHL